MEAATVAQPVKRVVPDRSQFGPGTVVVPCNDLARYHHFTHDLTLLDVPDGTVISLHRSASVVQNMNEAIEALTPESEWAWIIGDDHTFERDVILRLLDRDVDIVVPLCARRGPPFALVAFDEECGTDKHGRPLYHVMQFNDLPPSGGMVEVVSAGTAGMLVKRHVLDEMGHPWFANSDGITANEDVEFCRRARAAGYKVWLDCDVRIGHIGVMSVWPDQRNGHWGLTLDFQGAGRNDIFIAGGIHPNDSGAPDQRAGTLDW